ncbi:PQQ-dependent sugar dehydrogenase [Arenimonas sp. MALMAid1274]|uniref:PQQ-dependent sugar dehydrogenase n=1 Tax=Arenimonas sp. MALMAid1274 TaxID=3411630 RepID=UPI003BA30FC3
MRGPLASSLIPLLLAAACVAGPAAAQSNEVLAPSSLGPLRVTTLASGLQNPWAMAFLPDGRLLITERPGRLRVYSNGTLSAPITGLPAVWAQGQGGLLDVALDPDFARNQRLYLSYAEAGSGGKAGTAVMRARLVGSALQDVLVIFRQEPKLSTGNHFGSRLVFNRQGHLFITLGENNVRISAQALDQHQGKVVRLWPDGNIPTDNPFVGHPTALEDLWSYGHRNPQGATLNPWTGALWTVEHGAMGGDEINIPQAGKNYGWPRITHGLDYNGQPIPESVGTSAPGMEQPVHQWTPSIAPSGMAFYTGLELFDWQGDLFVGALAAQQLVRLEIAGDRVVAEERLLTGMGHRVRDVRNGPDGALYVLTDSGNGKLLRIVQAKPRFRRSLQGDKLPVREGAAPGETPMPKPAPVRRGG